MKSVSEQGSVKLEMPPRARKRGDLACVGGNGGNTSHISSIYDDGRLTHSFSFLLLLQSQVCLSCMFICRADGRYFCSGEHWDRADGLFDARHVWLTEQGNTQDYGLRTFLPQVLARFNFFVHIRLEFVYLKDK